jgi:YbgC/YbaW family acyl-CoA thioester hydrolase
MSGESTTSPPSAIGAVPAGGEPSGALPPHLCVERVRWADVDLVGIMRFSAFTRFVEHAEQEWLRAAGLPYREIFEAPTIWMPRRRLVIDYLAPARLDDPLAMATFVSRLGETALTVAVDVVDARDGAPRAHAEMVVVCVDRATFTKRPLPQLVRDAVRPWVADADAVRAALPSRLRSLPGIE